MKDHVKQDTADRSDAARNCAGFDDGHACSGRREFLVRAGVTAGTLILGVSGARVMAADGDQPVNAAPNAAPAANDDQAADEQAAQNDEVVIKLSEQSPLNKVGGWETLDTKAGRVIIVRTGESTFSACSAVCTHRGGKIVFDAQSQQLYCLSHGARFDLNGKVLRGPARQPLPKYGSQSAVALNLKPGQ